MFWNASTRFKRVVEDVLDQRLAWVCTRHLQTGVKFFLKIFLRVILTRSKRIWRGGRWFKLLGKYTGPSKAYSRIHRATFLAVCARFCTTARDKNIAKAALKCIFSESHQTIHRAFIYAVSEVISPLGKGLELTGSISRASSPKLDLKISDKASASTSAWIRWEELAPDLTSAIVLRLRSPIAQEILANPGHHMVMDSCRSSTF